ncbi:DNA-3-methyladenine glycosylase [Mesobacillus persicus]|uniref:Putative 3-methyladenine DNA glycosylase n=1 Tax=Mesobacillus persicus TaxID=930146 RepID=A0A1H8DTZ3_9BACI|nr:DNA-3-methyladenine glycosylase [Mesobacillus persicus]SEN10334.1 DNA-3-methyladenine glycosylase [Mesobacillus persicus]
MNLTPLDQSFFEQPTLSLARSLLGCLLVKETFDGVTAGYIVETEAYIGPYDQAAHSYNNRRTNRTEIMFHHSALAYTYLMHTHCLFNVVSGGEGNPEAVLIRALEPVIGTELMQIRRPKQHGVHLTNGPGKLTKAMDITMEDYGHTLTQPPLYIASGFKINSLSVGKRIGIDNSGDAVDLPWRFWITGNKYVSRHQKAEKVEGPNEFTDSN